jgi:hypothetical protein
MPPELSVPAPHPWFQVLERGEARGVISPAQKAALAKDLAAAVECPSESHEQQKKTFQASKLHLSCDMLVAGPLRCTFLDACSF